VAIFKLKVIFLQKERRMKRRRKLWLKENGGSMASMASYNGESLRLLAQPPEARRNIAGFSKLTCY